MEDPGLLPTLWLIQVTMEKQRDLLMRPKNDLLPVGFHTCGALPRSSTLAVAGSVDCWQLTRGCLPRNCPLMEGAASPKFCTSLWTAGI